MTKDKKTNIQTAYDNLMDGTYKKLEKTDTFKFDCSICGQCCKNRNDILLSPYDIYRLAKGLGMKPYDMIGKYCDEFLGSDSKVPLVMIKFKAVAYSTGAYTVCPFLRKKEGFYRCEVHGFKPVVCAIYPLGRAFKMDTETHTKELHYFLQPVKCNATDDEEHTVLDWLKDFDIGGSEEAFATWSDFLADIWEILDFRKLAEHEEITDKTREMFYVMFSLIYYELDTTKEFAQTFKENRDKVMDMILLFLKGAEELGIDIRPGKDAENIEMRC